MTAFELDKLYQQQVDVSYSGFWDFAKKNRAFNLATTNVIQRIYRDRLTNQNAYDELSYLIVAGQTFPVNATTNTIYLGDHSVPILAIFNVGTAVTVTTSIPHDLVTGTRIQFANIVGTGNITSFNGQIYTVTVVDGVTFTITSTFVNTGIFTSGEIIFPDSILDYFHFLRGDVRFTFLTLYTVVSSTFSTPIKITTNKRSTLRTGDQIVIVGIGGNTNANGTFYLKQANEFDYFLYTDQRLTVGAIGNGTQTGTGTISQVVKSTLRFKRSDEKGNIYGTPTIENPYYQQSKNLLKILPSIPCDQLNIDYIRKPYQIDVRDNTTDLSDYFNEPFQYLVVAEAARIFANAIRDQLLFVEETTQSKENE